jgi:hypothetical protein
VGGRSSTHGRQDPRGTGRCNDLARAMTCGSCCCIGLPDLPRAMPFPMRADRAVFSHRGGREEDAPCLVGEGPRPDAVAQAPCMVVIIPTDACMCGSCFAFSTFAQIPSNI